jgi:hypothetical protein
MGYTYEINVWDGSNEGGYHWLQIYTGDSLIKVVYHMFWAKRNGWKCIKLEWRH